MSFWKKLFGRGNQTADRQGEVGSLIVSCQFPRQQAKNWSASELEQVLKDCTVHTGNAVAQKFNLGREDVSLNVVTDPADPGAIFTWHVALGSFAEVERYTRAVWNQSVSEFG